MKRDLSESVRGSTTSIFKTNKCLTGQIVEKLSGGGFQGGCGHY
tara:strand:+ start:230 stop:361 length:132 start_codon:yes stop_codon:yes gene_type:complete